MAVPYPVGQPYPTPQPSWWSRNWKWFVPLGCLGCCALPVAFGVGVFLFVMGMIKTSDVYREAFQRAQTSPEVVAQIGRPVDAGWLVGGSINVSGPAGEANFAIPLTGPKGAGKVYVVAEKRLGRWEFSTLTFEDERSSKRVNLLTQ
jgi:Cytochrome oxidase complex assembly protein 1